MKRLALAGLALAFLTLPACGSTSLSTPKESQGGSSQPSGGGADAALAAKLPEKIRSAGKILVGTDPTYAPAEVLAADGKTIEGFDIDLFSAVAAKFGVKAEFQASPFEQIISGIDAKKYDVGVSSFTINAARMEKTNMVSYFTAGTRWAVQAGNPKKFDPNNPCGAVVAVQTGTTQQEEMLPAMQEKCKDKPITINSYDSQAEATASVASGKNDATIADSPVIDYAAKQSAGKLEAAGETFESAPYGYVIPKDQADFAKAVAEALTQLKADGTYDQILDKWGVAAGGLKSFEANPKP